MNYSNVAAFKSDPPIRPPPESKHTAAINDRRPVVSATKGLLIYLFIHLSIHSYPHTLIRLFCLYAVPVDKPEGILYHFPFLGLDHVRGGFTHSVKVGGDHRDTKEVL